LGSSRLAHIAAVGTPPFRLVHSSGAKSVIDRVASFFEELKRRKVIRAAGAYLVVAFVTVQVVDAVFDLVFADPETAGRLVLVALILGFPVAMVIAWIFDVSPPRFKKEDPPADAAARRTPEVDTGHLRRDSVAVLPFANLSDDPANSYFSEGITDDIITSIAHIRGIRVLSRASVSLYKDAGRSVTEIAAELEAATIVLGSVRRSGSQVRIVAEVIDATQDDHLWSETYDRELEDIFKVQSEVAQCIADAVARELPAADRQRIETRGTTNPEAYDLYLRGRFLWNQRTESAISEAARYFQRALEHDSDFALAHAAMAEAQTVLGLYGAASPRDVMPAAKRAADAALAIDPALGEALAAKACLFGVYDWDWGAAEAAFQEAIGLAPSYATVHQWYALNLLVPLGRFAAASEALEHANELDPGSAAIGTSGGIIAFYSRRYDAAIEALQGVLESHPRFGLAHYFLGQCHEELGQMDAAILAHASAVELTEDSSETLAGLAHAKGRAGNVDEAEALLARLQKRGQRRYVSHALFAQVLVGLGRHEEALAELEKAVEERATDLIWTGVRPFYDPIRELPRFKAVLERVGLSEL